MLFRLNYFGLPRSLPAATRSLSSLTQQSVVYHPYSVPRNSNGSLPVYTDIRNGGTRFLLTIRNIDGNISALAKELSDSLFPPGSPEASRLKVSVSRSKHMIIQGGTGRWKHNIVDWLSQKGF
ncbi:mitochondrial large subunit ribosomal protein-domain-containing protein [Lentinula aciculospora]|uniref:Large ribosomal subunit protein mL49 n=1 Tax=Lentinula aciculospora TaxID=153920 RepID=A0A9W9ATJ6_9AGAR|nr:mitochondrial large subunit ribosomal protein-domain-containing protein [Lentinula aciculospora]